MKKKNPYIGYIILEVLFGVATVVCLIIGLCSHEEAQRGCMFIFAITALAVVMVAVCMHLPEAIKDKKREKNISDPSTLAYQLCKSDSEYDCYQVIPNSTKQAAGKAAVNVVGALSFVFGGVGVFSSGRTSWLAFVSEKELVICDEKNQVMNDKGFRRFPVLCIENVRFESIKHYERVVISLNNSKGGLILDVPTDRYNPEQVCASFLKLTKDRLAPEAEEETIKQNSDEPKGDPFGVEFD